MRHARLLATAVVIITAAVASASQAHAQGTFAPGTVVQLQDTPHLWFADEHGVLHWGGDTRALSGKHIAWNNRVKVSLEQLQAMPIGDPWLSAGLLKDGDPIYLVKWESDWAEPQLFHIRSISDVELFGINGNNYGKFVLNKDSWETRYGINSSELGRSVLAPAAIVPVPDTVTAQDLSSTYENELRGNVRYLHKQIFVRATVGRIRDNQGEAPYNTLELEATSRYSYIYPGVECRFSPQNNHDFISLTEGVSVVVRGAVEGLDWSDVVIGDCVVVRSFQSCAEADQAGVRKYKGREGAGVGYAQHYVPQCA